MWSWCCVRTAGRLTWDDFAAEEEPQGEGDSLTSCYRCYPPDYPRRKTIRVEKHWGIFIGGFSSLEDAGKAAARLKREPKEKWPEISYCDTFMGGKGAPVQMNPNASATSKDNIIQINPYLHVFVRVPQSDLP